jgi:hypothetical protein
MQHCPSCRHLIEVERVRCPACSLRYEAHFALPRLARLAPEQLRLAEMLVLCAGNLKEMAAELDVSYPTLRKRLDALIEALRALRADDEERTRALLDAVEAGIMRAEEAARLIKEMSGGA